MSEDEQFSPHSAGSRELPVAPEVEKALQDIPKEKRTIIYRLLAKQNQFYSGPIMPPALLADLEKIVPGGANRALQLTEKEQAHRHHIEIRQNETFSWQVKISLLGGLAAFFGLIAGIIFCAANGYTWGVGSLAVISAFGVISHIVRLPLRSDKKSAH